MEKEKTKRELILEAAVKNFVAKGFQKAKVEEIAREADVGKGTVYEYFASKKDLFTEMLKFTLEHYMEQMEGQLETAANYREQLRLIISAHVQYFNDYRQMYRALFLDHSWLGQDFAQWIIDAWNNKIVSVQKILQLGIELGELKEMDTGLVATALLGMLEGICRPVFFSQVEIDPDEVAENLLDLILSGVSRS